MIATPRPTVASRVTAASRIVVRLHRSGRSLGKCLHTRWVRCSSSQCASGRRVHGKRGAGGDEGGGAQGGAGRACRGPLRQQSERVFGERRGRRRSQ
ncbi:hypothetical protein EMIHUDRAFT_443502 [Emiliania huxleyi CCMP1516]|uniref:Uncharacterized protein n=2 Tax=Emiliania huxleyi TaxID=2903 RepID=A0A0D3JRA8_EMIH1|nr:hypothetical protein EMIHUDRAFT_443502 [Emiliania huxleyi CCMP1516]EOD26043.1 hypothetical protein EMIHUDRAFT_443502 [Emiliania huxleyi CCMP1516]|eukprot:XP_005778472.1 hypothetical protein EMIHUDRAFT_443502 [Emiliania huxleyi CCMP1516]